jgi:hypothetical protein
MCGRSECPRRVNIRRKNLNPENALRKTSNIHRVQIKTPKNIRKKIEPNNKSLKSQTSLTISPTINTITNPKKYTHPCNI